MYYHAFLATSFAFSTLLSLTSAIKCSQDACLAKVRKGAAPGGRGGCEAFFQTTVIPPTVTLTATSATSISRTARRTVHVPSTTTSTSVVATDTVADVSEVYVTVTSVDVVMTHIQSDVVATEIQTEIIATETQTTPIATETYTDTVETDTQTNTIATETQTNTVATETQTVTTETDTLTSTIATDIQTSVIATDIQTTTVSTSIETVFYTTTASFTSTSTLATLTVQRRSRLAKPAAAHKKSHDKSVTMSATLVPTYYSNVCTDTAQYSSACSCVHALHKTVTVEAPTTTKTHIITKTMIISTAITRTYRRTTGVEVTLTTTVSTTSSTSIVTISSATTRETTSITTKETTLVTAKETTSVTAKATTSITAQETTSVTAQETTSLTAEQTTVVTAQETTNVTAHKTTSVTTTRISSVTYDTLSSVTLSSSTTTTTSLAPLVFPTQCPQPQSNFIIKIISGSSLVGYYYGMDRTPYFSPFGPATDVYTRDENCHLQYAEGDPYLGYPIPESSNPGQPQTPAYYVDFFENDIPLPSLLVGFQGDQLYVKVDDNTVNASRAQVRNDPPNYPSFLFIDFDNRGTLPSYATVQLGAVFV